MEKARRQQRKSFKYKRVIFITLLAMIGTYVTNSLFSHSLPVTTPNPFGVGGNPLIADRNVAIAAAKELGAVYFRPISEVYVKSWDGNCSECDLANQAGLKLVWTVRNTTERGTPSTPLTDKAGYQAKVATIIDKYRPTFVIVENEEDYYQNFNGTPEQYGQLLAAACETAKSKGTLCANGGIISKSIVLYIYKYLIDNGRDAEAADFRARAFDASQQNVDPNVIKGTTTNMDRIVASIKNAGPTHFNFHWYVEDPVALDTANSVLREVTGLAPISNEMGQRNEDAAVITARMNKVVELAMPYVVWYNSDTGPAAPRALVNPDGSLRPHGVAFAAFIDEHFGTGTSVGGSGGTPPPSAPMVDNTSTSEDASSGTSPESTNTSVAELAAQTPQAETLSEVPKATLSAILNPTEIPKVIKGPWGWLAVILGAGGLATIGFAVWKLGATLRHHRALQRLMSGIHK